MAKTPKKGERAGKESPGPSSRVPRYDDRPEVVRGGGGAAERNPSIPRYGDTEPDDPRRTHAEASDPNEDAEEELVVDDFDLDRTDDEGEER